MKDSTVRTVRTTVQALIAAAVVVPVMMPALGIQTSAGFGAMVVAIAAAVTRLHSVPAVSSFLNKYFGVPE